MKKFEYQTSNIEVNAYYPSASNTLLNKMGSMGWRFVNAVSISHSHIMFIFEKEISLG